MNDEREVILWDCDEDAELLHHATQTKAMRRIIGKLLCWVEWHRWADYNKPPGLACVRCPLSIPNRNHRWLLAIALDAAAKWRMAAVILTILLASTIWYGTAQAQTFPQPSPVVEAAAIEHSVPPALLHAVWQQECSRRVICPMGKNREWGPFQIRVVRAVEDGCRGEWWAHLPDSADCAARILAKRYQERGRWLYALSRYNGCRVCKKPTFYAQTVYRIYLSTLVRERVARESNLLARR